MLLKVSNCCITIPSGRHLTKKWEKFHSELNAEADAEIKTKPEQSTRLCNPSSVSPVKYSRFGVGFGGGRGDRDACTASHLCNPGAFSHSPRAGEDHHCFLGPAPVPSLIGLSRRFPTGDLPHGFLPWVSAGCARDSDRPTSCLGCSTGDMKETRGIRTPFHSMALQILIYIGFAEVHG